MAYVYDFDWDDQGDLGVWVLPNGEEELMLVEAMVCLALKKDDGQPDPIGDPIGEYLLASAIVLGPNDQLFVDGETLCGQNAQTMLERLVFLEKHSKQMAVNEQQTRLGIPPAEFLE